MNIFLKKSASSKPHGRRWPLLGLLLILLWGCGIDENVDDLLEFTKTVRGQEKAEVEPLPTIHPTESFRYTASSIVSPFSIENVIPQAKSSLEIDPVLPDQGRFRQPLEYFSLDSLKMVGTLKKDSDLYAIVFAPDGTVHRVSKGDFAGTQLGEILDISDGAIVLEETVRLSRGGWEKRKVSIALSEQK